jgi:bifunctional UDP-N-acetylglucosamine pyrophosphorylase/glucosamine-1-phosphate N-acetyltransferase
MTGIILAAGKSERTGTPTPKVLLPLSGRPMLEYVLDTCGQAGIENVIIVVGHQRELVEQAFADRGCRFVTQPQQKGTADAVLSCAGAVGTDEDVVILSGDVPLLTAKTLKRLVARHQSDQADVTLLTAVVADPKGYGRVLRDTQGRILDIVEEKDATLDERAIKEMNVGLYVLRWGRVLPLLRRIRPSPVTGEYYLPVVVRLAAQDQGRVSSIATDDPSEFMGVNTLKEHQQVQEALGRRCVR